MCVARRLRADAMGCGGGGGGGGGGGLGDGGGGILASLGSPLSGRLAVRLLAV